MCRAAGRATRRILISADDIKHLVGVSDLLCALEQNLAGPWIDDPRVSAFLRAHLLMVGDIIDIANDAGRVTVRLGVTPRGLRLMWSRALVGEHRPPSQQ